MIKSNSENQDIIFKLINTDYLIEEKTGLSFHSYKIKNDKDYNETHDYIIIKSLITNKPFSEDKIAAFLWQTQISIIRSIIDREKIALMDIDRITHQIFTAGWDRFVKKIRDDKDTHIKNNYLFKKAKLTTYMFNFWKYMYFEVCREDWLPSSLYGDKYTQISFKTGDIVLYNNAKGYGFEQQGEIILGEAVVDDGYNPPRKMRKKHKISENSRIIDGKITVRFTKSVHRKSVNSDEELCNIRKEIINDGLSHIYNDKDVDFKINIVHKLLEKISDQCKKILEYRHMAQLSHKEIAFKLGFNNVEVSRVRVHQCNKSFRKLYEQTINR